MRHSIEQEAGVASAAVRVGCGEGGYELRDVVEVVVERAHEHEGLERRVAVRWPFSWRREMHFLSLELHTQYRRNPSSLILEL